MPFTRLQARDQYVIDSIAQFLDRNVKAAYDTEVALTAGHAIDYSTPLTICEGKPDDPDIILNVPKIAIDTLTGAGPAFFEIGTNTKWRRMTFVLYCYPAVQLPDFQPCSQAAKLLSAYMRDAFGTEYIRMLDYSNPLFGPTNILFVKENIHLLRVQDPVPRGGSSVLAQEKHRFDFHFQVEYPVIESAAT